MIFFNFEFLEVDTREKWDAHTFKSGAIYTGEWVGK